MHQRLACLDVALVQAVGTPEGRVHDGVAVQLVEGVELVELGGPVRHRGGHVVGQLPAGVGAAAARLVSVTSGKTEQLRAGLMVGMTSVSVTSGKTEQLRAGLMVGMASVSVTSGKTEQLRAGLMVGMTSVSVTSGRTEHGKGWSLVCTSFVSEASSKTEHDF